MGAVGGNWQSRVARQTLGYEPFDAVLPYKVRVVPAELVR
jgi:hypothetical protein